MGVAEAIVAIGVGVFVVAMLLGALSRMSFRRIATIGIVLGLVFWGAEAILIFRGPDNPDLGETGWTIVVGILAAIYVVSWLVGAALGRVFRGRRSRSGMTAA